MTNGFIAFLLAGIISTAVADDTVTVYQYDGSVHCHKNEIITPDQAAAALQDAGVRVISSESRPLPFKFSGQCGTPTGQANVLVIDAADWNKLPGKRRQALGYSLWVFDQPVVEVYKYDGSLQCERGSEIPLEDMAGELTAAGIEVQASRKGTDGLAHIAVCGASTGNVNVYTIPSDALSRAEELGFRVLVTRKMSSGIATPPPARRGTAQPRTPPRAADTPGSPVPALW